MVDNRENIYQILVDALQECEPVINPNTDTPVFHIWIQQRRKDCPELVANSVMRASWLATGPEYIERLWNDIVFMCDHWNARCYINVMPKSKERILWGMHADIDQRLRDAHTGSNTKAIVEYHVKSLLDSAAGKCGGLVRRWVVDIDDPSMLPQIENILAKPEIQNHEQTICGVYPSKSGLHMITRDFRLDLFNKFWKEEYGELPNHDQFEIKPNNGTLLYIP